VMLRYVLATGFIASYLNMRLVVGRGFLNIYHALFLDPVRGRV